MTPSAMRVAVAEACGWSIVKNYSNGGLYGYPARVPSYDVAELPPGAIPDYPADLNACHEMERTLTDSEHASFRALLVEIVNGKFPGLALMNERQYRAWFSATAPQRCEAFLCVRGLWEEGT